MKARRALTLFLWIFAVSLLLVPWANPVLMRYLCGGAALVAGWYVLNGGEDGP